MGKSRGKLRISKGLVVFLLVVILIILGTAGYMLISRVSFIDALYMTVITISTVGYREITELTPAGKLFTIFIIIGGIGTVSYAVLQLASFLIEGGMKQIFRRRAMKNRIADLQGQIIVCGAGQTGSSVIEQFKQADTAFVVIEQDVERCREIDDGNTLIVIGDATSEDMLKEAGIERAKGLVCCLESDVENLYTVLTARGLNAKLHIVSRAIEKGSAEKLRRAGADKTISPNELGGMRMAYMMMKPHVVSFLDIVTRFDEEALDLEELLISESSEIAGLQLKEARLPEKSGLIIIAMRKPKGKLRFNPGPQERLSAGGSVLVLGKPDQIDTVRVMAGVPV